MKTGLKFASIPIVSSFKKQNKTNPLPKLDLETLHDDSASLMTQSKIRRPLTTCFTYKSPRTSQETNPKSLDRSISHFPIVQSPIPIRQFSHSSRPTVSASCLLQPRHRASHCLFSNKLKRTFFPPLPTSEQNTSKPQNPSACAKLLSAVLRDEARKRENVSLTGHSDS